MANLADGQVEFEGVLQLFTAELAPFQQPYSTANSPSSYRTNSIFGIDMKCPPKSLG